jgi:glycosyltransferase involved in cell wall biosynthesis
MGYHESSADAAAGTGSPIHAGTAEPMNVWIVNQYAIPPSQPGITRHFSLAAALNRRGHNVTLIASSFDHVTRREIRLNPGEMWRLETIEGVQFLWLRTPSYPGNTTRRVGNMLVFAWRVWRRWGMGQLARPDVVVGSSPHLFGAFAAWRLARAFGQPFVFEIRDLWPEALVQWGSLRAGHPVIRVLAWIERTLYRNATRIITLWPHSPPYIAARGGHPNKIVWISNGVYLDAIRPQPPRNNSSEPLTIMYLGAHGLANALHTILDAAALLRAEGYADKVRFRLVGDGPNKPDLIRQARTAGLGEMVRFEEPVPKRSVNDVIVEADAFILPLHRGGLYRWGMSPNKLFDYMAAARPIVLAVDAPSNPVAEAGAGLSVPAEDATAVAEAIKTLLVLSPEERWEMGLRGRRHVEAHHDLTRLAERFEACLLGAVRGDRIATDTGPLPATPSGG